MPQLMGSKVDRENSQRKWVLIMADWEGGDACNNNRNVGKRSHIWGKYIESNCGYRIVVYFGKAFTIGNVWVRCLGWKSV